jgi:hypothetical protein
VRDEVCRRGAVAQIKDMESERARVLGEVRDPDEVAMIDSRSVMLQGIERAAEQCGWNGRRRFRAAAAGKLHGGRLRAGSRHGESLCTGPFHAGPFRTGRDAGETRQSDPYERSTRALQNRLSPVAEPACRLDACEDP